jgi:hypothetical protein
VQKLVVAWEEEEDLWNISGGNYHKKDARHRAKSYDANLIVLHS